MKTASVLQAQEQLAGGNALFIDVREKDEFAAGHAEGAVNYPLSHFAAEIDKQMFEKGKAIYVICQSGGRSAVACTMLDANGFTDVTNVDGGTSAWQQAKLPMISA